VDKPARLIFPAGFPLPACPPTLESPAASPHSHSADDDWAEGIPHPCHALPQSSLPGPCVVPSFWHESGPIFLASDTQVKSNYIAAPPDSDAIAASFRVHYPVLTRTADTWNEQRKGREQARSDITSAVTQEIASLQSPWVGINVEGTDPLLAGIARGDIPTEGLRLEWSSDNTLTAYAPSFAPMPIAHVRAGEGQAESDAQAGQAQLPGAVQASIQRALTWPASIAYREHDGILMAMKDGLRIQLQEAGETHEVHRERACLLCQPHSARTRR
jgi:hypothetical protein